MARFFLLILAFLFSLSTVCLPEPLIRLGSIEGSSLVDLSARILTEAYRNIGYEIEVVVLPAERSILLSNNGILDGQVARIQAVGRQYPNLIRVATPVSRLEGLVFSKHLNFTVSGWDSLRPYAVGIVIGIKFCETGVLEAGIKSVTFTSPKEMFSHLDMDRIDACIADRMDGLIEIKSQGLTGIKPLSPPLIVRDLYHYLHIKNQHLVPLINESIKKMKQQGRLEEIRQHYQGIDSKTGG